MKPVNFDYTVIRLGPNYDQSHTSGIHDFTGTTLNGLADAQRLIDTVETKHYSIFLDHFREKGVMHSALEIERFVRRIKQHRPQWKIYLFYGLSDNIWQQKIEEIPVDDSLCLDFHLYRGFREVVVHKLYPNTRPSNFLNTKKFLYYGGNMARANRIRLFKKIVDARLIDSAEHTLFYKKNMSNDHIIRAWVSELSDTEFDAFMSKYQKMPPDVFTHVFYSGFMITGVDGMLEVTYNIEDYLKTDFSVVCESYFDRTIAPCVSEKTYKTILNHHPFIIAGDTGTLKYLKHLGFATFDEWIKVNYDSEISEERRLNHVVTNTEYWLDNLHQHSEEVERAVSHNFENMYRVYEIYHNHFLTFADKNSIDHRWLDDVLQIGLKNPDANFRKFYLTIKDISWPDCETIDEFKQLPQHIQDECVTIHGLDLEKIYESSTIRS